ncbi:hypothetical protein [Cerasicoccus arenae]|uniref:Uncharacterized protein n=1 Tax=Cerasicoccus arenae TaxID=424488 RepID=A0A8J3DJY8_9BACT|nr:hypothetical protein [Cerasicoccus arenae]MBK1858237.1 hypothetical protein [Cerasicoccus arenae]GHC02079.1 hypothetical protein GCM10007047_18240 [Cerasicoccus arenae]
MDTLPIVVGSHAFFIADGTSFTSPEAGTVAREAKPDEDETNWATLGIIAVDGGSEIEPEEEYRDVMKYMPGRAVLYDKILKSSKLKGTLEMEDFSALANQLWLGGLAVTTGQFNPLERAAAVKGWLKLQVYDSLNNEVVVLDLYVCIRLSGALTLSGEVKPSYEWELLHSTLNTGTLS